MLGPAVNAITIVVCSLAGVFLVRGIPERFEELIKKAIGLSIVYVGVRGAMDNNNVLLLILSMVSGAVIGELINIDRLMNRLGAWAEAKIGIKDAGSQSAISINAGTKNDRSFSKGFVAASILYCSGSMAIVGSMNSGLSGNHELLYAKSILDGAISVVFGASMGIGVAFSALPVFVYQGAIALAAMGVRDLLSQEIITEMSAVGSLVVAAIGFNFLGIKEIRVANLIPAIFIPLIYLTFKNLINF